MSRLAFLPSLIAPLSAERCFGGAEMATLALAEALAGRGHDVELFALRGSQGAGLRVVEIEHGTPILRPGKEHSVGSRQPSPFPEIFAALEARAARGALDAVHLHLLDAEALALADRLARRHAGLRVLATLHLAAVFPETAEAVRRLGAAGTPIQFVAPSQSAAESYRAEGFHVVPNGLDLDAIQFFPEGPADGRLAWAGRRSAEKGLDAALAIAARAARPIHVAGPEAPEGRAAGAPDAVGLTDHGRLPRARVYELLGRAAATLITSSIPESQSLVAAESLAAGTPVVAFSIGALPEMIEDGVTGFLVPPGDLDAAGEAVAQIPALSRRRARAAAEARFSLGAWVDAHEALLRAPP